MVKNLFGVIGISLVDMLAQLHGPNINNYADFIAAIIFFLCCRIYDRWKLSKRVARIVAAETGLPKPGTTP
jgi:hypothetical protein